MINKKLFLIQNSGATAFTPLSLSPLSWWNNGSSSMAADGSQWTDTMGNYTLTAAGAARPTFTAGAQNGLPSFTFGASNTELLGARMVEIDNVTKFSMWMVSKRGILSYDDAGSTTERTNYIHNSDNLMYGLIAKAAGLSYGTYAQANAFNYSLLIYDGTQGSNATRLVMYGGGVVKTLTFTLTIPATSPTMALGKIRMGTFAGGHLAGQILEAGVMVGAFSAGQITNLNSYLAAKYAL